MPGVPSSIGCDECRKHKKKCIISSTTCDRCLRLDLKCVGMGLVRYTFVPQMVQRSKRQGDWTILPQSRPAAIWIPPQMPSNAADLLQIAFSSLLKPTNSKYDLTCLGDWFASVPMRLGANDVLDAAASAFVHSYAALRGSSGEHRVAALSKYGHALSLLRTTLRDPLKAKSPHVLGAIFLILVSQGWCINEAQTTRASHMDGIIYVLNASAGQQWNDELEESMRLNMLYAAAFEAITNPAIELDPWYYSLHNSEYRPYHASESYPGQLTGSLSVHTIMKISRLIHEPVLYYNEMRTTYHCLLREKPFVLESMCALSEKADSAGDVGGLVQIESRYLSLIFYTLILNAFLSAFGQRHTELYNEAVELSWEAIRVSDSLAGHVSSRCVKLMPGALFAASLATTEPDIMEGIRATLARHAVFFVEANYLGRFEVLKQRIRSLREHRLAGTTIDKRERQAGLIYGII